MRHFLLIIAIALSTAVSAYDGVSKLFVEENGDLFNSLSLSTRYELLNNYGRDDKSVVINNLQTTESRILSLSPQHLVIATSSGRTVEMKLLQRSKSDTVIAVIETVATPYKDSRLSFYDTKWKRLDASTFIKMPTIDDFFTRNASKEVRNEVKSAMQFAMIEMSFQGETMVAQCNMQNFFLGDDFARYKPFVTQRIVYAINKAKLKKK